MNNFSSLQKSYLKLPSVSSYWLEKTRAFGEIASENCDNNENTPTAGHYAEVTYGGEANEYVGKSNVSLDLRLTDSSHPPTTRTLLSVIVVAAHMERRRVICGPVVNFIFSMSNTVVELRSLKLSCPPMRRRCLAVNITAAKYERGAAMRGPGAQRNSGRKIPFSTSVKTSVVLCVPNRSCPPIAIK